MKYTNDRTIREAESFKDELVRLMERHGMTDKDLASVFGVSCETVGRWKHYNDECQMPAFALRMFSQNNKSKEFQVQSALLRYLLAPYNLDVLGKPAVGELDGDLTNEIRQIAVEVGPLAEGHDLKTLRLGELAKHARRLIEIGYTIEAELESKVKR